MGGGTGMICYEFKGGNGTSSRKIDIRLAKMRRQGPTPWVFFFRQISAVAPSLRLRVFL